MQSTALTIGTRGSPLALVQARQVHGLLSRALGLPEDAIAIAPIRTTGDKITDRPLAEVGGKGLFTKEIDEALLDGRVDLAVHSAKDLETHLPDGIVIAACLEREDVRDAFMSPVAATLADLPAGSRVGTASQRRQALVRLVRPDVEVVSLRGNVQTRLDKLAAGEVHATLLALAGLKRLGFADKAASLIPSDDWLPAAGQGTVAITARADDAVTLEKLSAIDHRPSSIALSAERALLEALDGSCRTPIGALARLDGGKLDLRGVILKIDGSDAHRLEKSGPEADARAIGLEVGAALKERGGPDFFVEDS